jgi:hypothetical protein
MYTHTHKHTQVIVVSVDKLKWTEIIKLTGIAMLALNNTNTNALHAYMYIVYIGCTTTAAIYSVMAQQLEFRQQLWKAGTLYPCQ